MSHTARLSSISLVFAALAFGAVSSGCGSASKPEATGGSSARLTVTGELPAKAAISVTVKEPPKPPDLWLVASPPGSVTLQGSATVGSGAVAPGTIVFAVDASQATQGTSDGTCDPGTTGINTILGCEIAAALQTNTRASPTTVTQTGVVVFGGGAESPASAAAADMNGDTPGDQPFAAPGTAVEAVLQSITLGKVAKFTERTVATPAPSFAAGLQAAGVLAGTGPAKTVVFLANGANGAGPTVSSVAFPEGVVVRAFALGNHACDAASEFGSLDAVKARGAVGSTCQRLTSLSDLPDVTLAEATKLQALTVVVDGGAPVDISSSTTPPLPQAGPASVQYSYTLQGLAPGAHEICVQADGVDSGGPGLVKACVKVTVASIALTPATHVSELGTPGQTHTVTATVTAGAAGGVPGIPVTFDFVSGPNAPANPSSVSRTTDASGQASFTYTALQHCKGLGTDTIQACFTDSQGTKGCASATQKWQDTIPPVPSAPPGPNPGGNTPGSSGNGGQNPSGFYRLVAVDAVDEDPQVFLKDAGSGTVFGPFKSGIAVKYTQAPGAKPDKKGMAGEVAWHITGKGDAEVYAKDCADNVSDPVWALVPPKPK